MGPFILAFFLKIDFIVLNNFVKKKFPNKFFIKALNKILV
jgi:hypothetical protein